MLVAFAGAAPTFVPLKRKSGLGQGGHQPNALPAPGTGIDPSIAGENYRSRIRFHI